MILARDNGTKTEFLRSKQLCYNASDTLKEIAIQRLIKNRVITVEIPSITYPVEYTSLMVRAFPKSQTWKKKKGHNVIAYKKIQQVDEIIHASSEKSSSPNA